MCLKHPIVILLTFYSFVSFSQDTYYIDESGDEHIINTSTSDGIIEAYLTQNDLKEIEFNPRKDSRFPFRVQTKKGYWIMCDRDQNEFMSAEKYSVEFPNKIMESLDVTIATKKKKKYIFSTLINHLVEEPAYSQIKIVSFLDTITEYNFDLERDEAKIDTLYAFALEHKKKWGAAFINARGEDQPVFYLTPICFEKYDDIPFKDIEQLLKLASDSERNRFTNPIYEISENLPTEAIAFEYNLDHWDYLYRAKTKKGDWYLYNQHELVAGAKGFSMRFPDSECYGWTITEHKGENYIFVLGEGSGVSWEPKIDHVEQKITKYTSNYPVINVYGEDSIDQNGNFVYFPLEFCDYLMFEKDNKWALGIFSPSSLEVFQISGFHFSSKEKLPDTLINGYITRRTDDPSNVQYDESALAEVDKYLQQNTEIDIVSVVGNYQEDQHILKVRHSETKRWSLDILGGYYESTDLPIAASQIKLHSYGIDEYIVEVWCDDKVGFYYYDGKNIKQILNCEYDDFEYVFLDATYGCALKINGKWELYKSDSPEKLVEGSAEDIDGLIDLWINRH